MIRNLRGKLVLIVDDDPDLRGIVRRILESVGMIVDEAASVAEGVDHALARPPHLILLDLNMPDEDGFAFLEKRKSHPILSSMPVVVLSVQRDPASIKRSVALGATNYIVKPLQAAILLQKVRQVMLERGLRKEGGGGDMVELPSPVPGSLTVFAEIRKIGFNGLLVDCPIRIGPRRGVELESDLLKGLSRARQIFHSTDTPAVHLAGTQYRNYLQLITKSEKDQNDFERSLRTWIHKKTT